MRMLYKEMKSTKIDVVSVHNVYTGIDLKGRVLAVGTVLYCH